MDGQDLKTEDMCEVDENVAEVLKKLKFTKNKTSSAVFMKVLIKECKIVVDEEFEDITTEELMEELPERQPRFVAYSFKHETKDGRTTYPYCFIYYNPAGCNTKQVMLYAGSRNKVLALSKATQSFELREKESLTDELIIHELKLK